MKRRQALRSAMLPLAASALIWAGSLETRSGAVAQEVPHIPDPVPVTLDPSTTALLVLHLNSAPCPPRPSCLASLPAIGELLQRARQAGVFVVQTITAAGLTTFPETGPLPNEPIVTSPADSFYGTGLDDLLRERGIKTAIIVGIAVTIDEDLLREVDRWVNAGEFPNRSRAVQTALVRLREERTRRHSLLAEMAKLDPVEERGMAGEWLAGAADWRRS